jgi:hypothetical protein
VTYSVTATGGGLTYQWRKNGVALANGGNISGATTSSLTISAVTVADNGTYDVVVGGTCPPQPITSNGAVLTVATPPTITTQPANVTVCEGANASFSVVTGGVPAPTIFQWQVSTNGGATFTNIATGAFTSTYTLTNVTTAMSGNQYRVIITFSCNATVTVTSTAATLTVNAKTPVTLGNLPAKICLSDTLINLVGTPIGGVWSGIGVFGNTFLPYRTAVGTYTLTYTYTNASGCVSTGTLTAKVEDCPERIRLLRDDGVLLYPNPNNGRFNLRLNSTLYNYLGLKVYTMTGALVKIKTFTGLQYGRVIPVDLGDLAAGVYQVLVFYDDGARTAMKDFEVIITHN